ncbi:RNA 3'-terminal phosphate cyclase [Tothia fuscella]|uniref:RNA 3'-terminal phosphate cyclase n=1 Tax=Tothia fuscella TaxID=1048955 RepID=A0A9P4TSE0_9PEZI|nr:RNA 3'-terminal phosphate cyclase [Tothia fuscella]
MSKPDPIHLPGTTLEGGGQLLRIAIGLSALTSTPIHISSIRGNRSGGGGLKLQHLMGVKWLAKACGASTAGAEKGSKTLQFWLQEPAYDGLIFKRQHEKAVMERTIDIGSPGAVGLVFQAILPYLLFSGHGEGDEEEEFFVTIKGGTNVGMSPSIDYIQQVLLPVLKLIGLPPITAKLHHRGWSTGRNEIGAVTFGVTPLRKGSCLPAFFLNERGDVITITATVLAPSSTKKDVHKEVEKQTREAFGAEAELNINFEDSYHAKRLYILLVATTTTSLHFGRDYLYDRKITSYDDAIPKLVAKAVAEVKRELDNGGSCVDEYMRDQLSVFQMLARGRSEVFGGLVGQEGGLVEGSLHARTAWWVGREMLGVVFGGGGACEGAGFVVGEGFVRREKVSGGVDGGVSDGDEDLGVVIERLSMEDT